MNEQVLVIGAGPAGLTSAYMLEQAGLAYRVVDRAPIVGSTWASLYPSLKLNTIVPFSHLPGARLTWRSGWYISGRQLYEHICAFAEKHAFNLHLKVEVTRVSPEADGWRVESSEGSAWYPAVIIATGKFSHPFIPDIPGLDEYRGHWIHAHAFRDPEMLRGQRVLIIGNGPSGADIAVALTEVTDQPVLLSIRSDVLIARRYPLGLPDAVWRWLTLWMPDKIRMPLLQRISWQTFPDLAKYGLKNGRNREERLGTSAPVRGPELFNAIKAGKVCVAAGIERFDGDGVVLKDGSREKVDTVILATGYRPALDYLDLPPYEVDKEGWPVREPGQQVAGHPGLYIVGRFYQGFGPIYNMQGEAKLTAEQIKGRLGEMQKG